MVIVRAVALRLEAIASRSKDATRGTPGLATRSKKLIVTKGIATRSKDALRFEAIASRVYSQPLQRRVFDLPAKAVHSWNRIQLPVLSTASRSRQGTFGQVFFVSQKNKMEPTNPNANTIEELICPKDTLVGHSCGTLCRTLLWATLVGNSCGTLL